MAIQHFSVKQSFLSMTTSSDGFTPKASSAALILARECPQAQIPDTAVKCWASK